MFSDDELRELYQDPTFYGSFSGARNFQIFLKTDFNEDIPIDRIYKVLKTIRSYVISLKPIKRFPRRKYDVAGFGSLLQADLAVMFDKNGYKYFLVLCDVFSRHLFTEPLKDKTAKTVKKALQKIFDQIPTPISKLETDSGTNINPANVRDMRSYICDIYSLYIYIYIYTLGSWYPNSSDTKTPVYIYYYIG